MKEYEKLNHLLKQSLQSAEFPSEALNTELKFKMIRQVKQTKSISLWWSPMVISTCFAIVGYLLIKVVIHPGILQNMLIAWCMTAAIFNFIITLVGVKYFDLRNGARVTV